MYYILQVIFIDDIEGILTLLTVTLILYLLYKIILLQYRCSREEYALKIITELEEIEEEGICTSKNLQDHNKKYEELQQIVKKLRYDTIF